MKKQDVLDAVQNKFTAVLSVRKVEQIENVAWYLANVLDATGESATKRNVGFYVLDEGEVDEVAYWHGSEPKPPTPEKTCQKLLQEYLTALVAAGTIEGGQIQMVDADNKTAVVTAWVSSGVNIEARLFFVDKDAQGSWRRREIV